MLLGCAHEKNGVEYFPVFMCSLQMFIYSLQLCGVVDCLYLLTKAQVKKQAQGDRAAGGIAEHESV